MMNKLKKTILYEKTREIALSILGLDVLKQEIMLRMAFKEKGLNYKEFDISIDHVNGWNIVNGIKLPIIYPDSFFEKANAIVVDKKMDFYFNGNMDSDGDRVNMLSPFIFRDSKIINSNYGRSPLNKNKFNYKYYKELKESNFGLCPHQKSFVGNASTMWTYRFIECCICHTIPILFEETPLGDQFIDGFHYFIDKDILNVEKEYSLEKCRQNYELCVQRHSLNNSYIKSFIS